MRLVDRIGWLLLFVMVVACAGVISCGERLQRREEIRQEIRKAIEESKP